MERSPGHGWAARAAALQYERPVAWTIVAAIGAMLAALASWIAVLIPQGGNIRANPLLWLLALPLLVWIRALVACARWAMLTLWLALVAAPGLALLALFVSQRARAGRVLEGAGDLDTPLAMLIILGLSLVLAATGLILLRRTSLPGGTRPATYREPGTRPAGLPAPLPAEAVGALQVGSLTLSATLIDGMAACIGITLLHDEPLGPFWPVAIPLVMVAAVGTLLLRGAARLIRRHPGAAADLRRGWCLGMACPVALLLLVWVWPLGLGVQEALSVPMVLLGLLGAWGGRRALRRLREIRP